MTQPPSGAERRRAPRVGMPPEGGVVSVVGARILDVSTHGMRIESLMPLESRSIHRFRMAIAGEKVDVDVRVACCERLDPVKRRYGVGMEFVGVDDDWYERMSQALAQLLQ